MTPIAAEELIRDGALVLDVREPDEWSAGHVREAIHVPMANVEARIDEIARDRTTVVVCRSGGRSQAIAQLLSSLGVNAVNLAGGLRSWEQAGLPIVTDRGGEGRIVDL